MAEVPRDKIPIRDQLTSILDDMSKLTQKILLTLSQEVRPETPVGSVSKMLSELVARDNDLTEALLQLQVHSYNTKQIQDLNINLKNLALLEQSSIQIVHKESSSMQTAVSDLKPLGQRIREALENPLQPSDILSYAQSLAAYTSAPPQTISAKSNLEFGEDALLNSLPVNALPPFPTEVVMRRGHLQFGSQPVGDSQLVGGDEQVRLESEKVLLNHLQQAPRETSSVSNPEADDSAFDFGLDLNPDL